MAVESGDKNIVYGEPIDEEIDTRITHMANEDRTAVLCGKKNILVATKSATFVTCPDCLAKIAEKAGTHDKS